MEAVDSLVTDFLFASDVMVFLFLSDVMLFCGHGLSLGPAIADVVGDGAIVMVVMLVLIVDIS